LLHHPPSSLIGKYHIRASEEHSTKPIESPLCRKAERLGLEQA
jgi:hypothetical protein